MARFLNFTQALPCLVLCFLGFAAGNAKSDELSPVYIADALADEITSSQGWGTLGLNTEAKGISKAPEKLRINDKVYERGLGHHANGEIVVPLEGQYRTFECEIGVQWQGGTAAASVVFQVFVDEKKAFDSGVMHERDPAKKVSVSVAGGNELRLVASDAGDGIICDHANWCEARLIPDPAAQKRVRIPPVDIAPSARVVTSDPNRMQGTLAKRNEAIPAEDIFLMTELKPSADGSYVVPSAADGRSAIGLEWPEMRVLRGLELHWSEGAVLPPADGVQLQYWVGFQGRVEHDLFCDNRSCPWHGGWKPLPAKFESSPGVWRWKITDDDQKDQPRGVYRVRWVFPASQQPIVVKGISAFGRSSWATADVRVELQNPTLGERAMIAVSNGEFAASEGNQSPRNCEWDVSRPAVFTVRYSRPRSQKNDRTVLRFELPAKTVSVAVEDVLKDGCVYVPNAGLFVTCNPPKTTLPEYLKAIAKKKTVLEQVRALPDQTFAQALAKTHHAVQDGGPTFATLACDNRKYIVHRGGEIQFDLYDVPDGHYCYKVKWWSQEPDCRLAPCFGQGKGQLSRHLDGGWLPKPTTVAVEDGVKYQQCTYMAPVDDQSPPGCPSWYRVRAACVAEYTIENTRNTEADVSLKLVFSSKDAKKSPDAIRQIEGGLVAAVGDRLVAYFDAAQADPLSLNSEQANVVNVAGKLAAGKSARLVVYFPAWPVKSSEYSTLLNPTHWADGLERYWKDLLAAGLQIDIPDPLLADVIRASQVHCYLAARNQEQGRYVEPWVGAMNFGPIDLEASTVIRGMDICGHADFARRGLDYILDKRYNDEGFFTTGYTLSGTGINLWVLAEHCARHPDRQWLETVAPQLVKTCKWIAQRRALTKRQDVNHRNVPEYGLMPPGVNGDYARIAYSFYNDSQYCHGLEMIGKTLSAIGHPEAAGILAEARQYREDLIRAFRWTQARCPVVALRNGTWAPNHPGTLYLFGNIEEMIPPTDDSNRCWSDSVEVGSSHLAANGIFEPHSADTAWIMDYLEDYQFLRTGWLDYPAEQTAKDVFNLGGFSKVQPYYVRNAEISAMRDDVKPFLRTYFNELNALVNQETLYLCEHFADAGAWNKTHETGWFLCQTAIMLAMERGDDLWLAPMMTDRWLEDGKTVAVRNLPTQFGPVAYKITSHVKDGYVEASVESPTRVPPKHVVIRLRHPEGKRIRSVFVDGKPHIDFDPAAEAIRLTAADGKRKLKVQYYTN
jgi:hypothetical protein